MNELTREWVEIAENDYLSANDLLYAGEFPLADSACFHCQQSVEKYIKAYLQENMIRFERIHNLAALLELCLQKDSDFSQIEDALGDLENYSVAVRYPGVTTTVEIALKAFTLAGTIRAFLRTKLQLPN